MEQSSLKVTVESQVSTGREHPDDLVEGRLRLDTAEHHGLVTRCGRQMISLTFLRTLDINPVNQLY